ncbi:MAG: response regulator [Planctomycetota bacterium]
MLVLSRQKNQRVTFPGLGITVEILDIRGSKVRVGVEAPMEVRILRDELPDRGSSPSPAKQSPKTLRLPRSLRHELRNALHETSLMMHVYHKRAQNAVAAAGDQPIEADQMFEAIVSRLEAIAGHTVLSADASEQSVELKKPAPAKVVAPGEAVKRPTRGDALIVDDDANERELLAGFLRMCDYRVDTVADGQEALDYLNAKAAPGVILLDMHMPRCDGADFLRTLRKRRAFDETSVFVVSGATSNELGVSPELGYTRWFDKPLDPREVVEELNRVETRVA